MTVFALAKAGYGTVAEIRGMDTPEFLDLVEFESISRDIETHYYEKAKNGRGN
jgi:hypothetical protein